MAGRAWTVGSVLRSVGRVLRPGTAARWGMTLALLVLVLPYWAYFGGLQRIGLGPTLDWLVWLAAALLLLPLGAFLIAGLLSLLRPLPKFAAGLFIMAALMIGFIWPAPLVGLVTALLVGGLGATLATLLLERWGSWPRRIITTVVCGATLAGISALLYFFQWPGTKKGSVEMRMPELPAELRMKSPDPSATGSFEVKTVTYGPGTHLRRPEFGAHVTFKSRTVDGSLLLKDVEGWKGKIPKWYWGFDTSQMPLNATVWYPEGAGPFPLVLIVHGNHQGQEASDPGYAYLGELLASRGYVFASIDENFINGGLPFGYGQKETAARGWLLLEHLKLLREWSQSTDHPFAKSIDWENIGLMGHSRGGEAVATAAEFNRLKYFPGDANQKFDYGFNIKALIAIAPADGQFKPAGQDRTLRDVSYFTIHGSFDYDVSSFAGAKQFERTTFSPAFPGFKASLYIYRANHGQFNTVWGQKDWSVPGFWLLNTQPLLSGEDQRQAGKVYFSAFLDATLKGKAEYRALFEDARKGAQWLPDTLYVTRYADAGFRSLCSFDEDYDLSTCGANTATLTGTSLTTWREQRIHTRWGDRGDNGVYLGWRKEDAKKGRYEIRLATVYQPTPGSAFEFALGDADEVPSAPKKKDGDKEKDKNKNKDEKKKEDVDKPREPLDLTVEMVWQDGSITRTPLSAIGPIFPPLKSKMAKLHFPTFDAFSKESEPVLQRYRIAVPANLQAIRFCFDRSEEGTVILDDLGFTSTLPPTS